MGFAATIVEQGADHVLALKKNQEKLFEDVVTAFEPSVPALPINYHRTVSKGHARIETRECWPLCDPDILSYLNRYKQWMGLRSLIKVSSTHLENSQSIKRPAISFPLCP
jgi:hypothetical protein